jgi:glycosyltransferase involved in cell wall biosynthesis
LVDTFLVSIVTPSFNSAEYIERAIVNVLEQDIDSVQHVIVDGASKDGTVAILSRYPHLRWISEPDDGQANALNKGFHLARSEVVGWLNADDTYTPGAVRIAVDYLLSHPDCDIVYGDCNILRENGSILAVFQSRQAEGYGRLLGGLIHTPAVFWRRRLFDRIGFLDETLHYNMDNEFWLRAAPVADQTYLPIVLANFHHRAGSKSMSGRAEFGPELCRIYECAFEREPYRSSIPPEVRRRTLGRFYWSTGINLTLAGAPDRAGPYLRAALEHYGIMLHPDVVAECIVVQYEERAVLSRSDAMQLIQELPIEDRLREQAWHMVDRQYHQLRFHAAHNRRDWAEVRSSGWQVLLRKPGHLANRGFLSIWAESLLGSQAARQLREWI